MTDDDASLSKNTWNILARDDPMWFIASLPGREHQWDTHDFFKSGEDDVINFMPIIAHPHPEDAVLLELGCGIGRHTFAFSRHFKMVIAVDVSEEMVQLAEKRRAELGVTNVQFVVNDGASLQAVESESVDVCFSFLVLQHVPAERIVKHYIREMGRVLSPGGIAIFQLPVVPDTVYGTLRQTVRTGINTAVKLLVRLTVLNLKRLRVNSPAYRGVRLSTDQIRRTAQLAALEVTSITDTRRGWTACYSTLVRCRKS